MGIEKEREKEREKGGSERTSSTGGKTSWIERVGKVFFFPRKGEKEKKGKEDGKGREGGEKRTCPVPILGLEPRTSRLRVCHSTN